MKKLLFAFFYLTTLPAVAQNYCMTAPQGYGAAATGGAGGVLVTVNTVAALKTELLSEGAKTIIVAENLTFDINNMINGIVADKTLLGMRGVRLVQNDDKGILELKKGSNNVIIRNLIFEGTGAFDMNGNDLLQNSGCNNLWVDHCEFYDGLDGNFDNTKKSDNITVSWCKFGYNKPPRAGGLETGDHRFSNLVGGGESDAPDDGHYSITFMCCYWANGVKDRMPRARNAELHIVNCLYDSNVGSKGINLTAGTNGTSCFVEKNYFKNINHPVYVAGENINVKLAGNKGRSAIADRGTLELPDYTCDSFDADSVENYLTSIYGAGATLNLASDGTLSTDFAPTTNECRVRHHSKLCKRKKLIIN